MQPPIFVGQHSGTENYNSPPYPKMSRASGIVRPYFTKSGVVHRKKCRHPKTPGDVSRRFCLVCGAKAENYNFGVVSCESCKAFFRRNAHKKTLGDAGFACSFRHGRCEVTLATRKKCPGCRLARCFGVGMQADLIQRGDVVLLGDSLDASASSPPLSSTAERSDQLRVLWQQLQRPLRCQPSPLTHVGCNATTAERPFANVLLVGFLEELRQLVADTMLCDIAAPQADLGRLDDCPATRLALLEAFVQQAVKFARGLRQIGQLDRPDFLALMKARVHAALFPLSCAGHDKRDASFAFTVNGRRVACQPVEMFADLVRQSGHAIVDYSALMDFGQYLRQLTDATEMRHDLLALFCATKLLQLPDDCGIADSRLRDACSRLSLRYHQHLTDALFYHFPFEFDEKLRVCCSLFKWSLEFDRTLEKFILYCPLSVGDLA